MALLKVDTSMLDLPDESLLLVLRYLQYKDLVRLSEVCGRLKAVVCDDCLWKWQCQYYYLIDSCSESSWRDMFIKMHKEYGKYIEHYSDIRGAWNKPSSMVAQAGCFGPGKKPKLLVFSCEGLKVVVVIIPDGASEDSITDVETSRYGSEDVIPLDLRLSYRIHNGQRLAADNSEITPGLMGGGHISNHVRSDMLLPIDGNYSEALSARFPSCLLLAYCTNSTSVHCMPLKVNNEAGLCNVGNVYNIGQALFNESGKQGYFVASSFKDWFCNYAEDLEKNVFHILHQKFIIKFYPEPGCVATTSAVTVKPTTIFMPELCYPGHNYFFAYRIIMSMDSEAPPDLSCQLESRHWVITYGDGKEEVVDGPGVVGEYPIMRPGTEYAWISCCTFHTKTGCMKGFFRMRNLQTGVITDVECPCFHMKVPPSFTMPRASISDVDDNTDTDSSDNSDS